MSSDFCRCKSAEACGNSSKCKCRRALGRPCVRGLCHCGDGCTNTNAIEPSNSLMGSNKLDSEVKIALCVELKNDKINVQYATAAKDDMSLNTSYSNCWCECPVNVLVDVSKWTLDWPKSVPSGLSSFAKQLVDEYKWPYWTSRRAQLMNYSLLTTDDACQRVYLITRFTSKSQLNGEQLALVWFNLPSSAEHINKYQQGYLSLVSTRTLQRLKHPIWDGCKFDCGGIHEEKYPCPVKVQAIKQAIQEMMLLMKADQDQQQQQQQANNKLMLMPEFPCPFGNCAELFHDSTNRCVSLLEAQQASSDIAVKQTKFEMEGQRPCLKIFSWNTQKTFLSSKGLFSRKGYSSIEKQAGIGWPNIKRAYLPEEAKLYETLVDNLKEEIDRIKPDLFMFQEFGPMEDRWIERFLWRLGISNNKEFKWKVVSFPCSNNSGNFVESEVGEMNSEFEPNFEQVSVVEVRDSLLSTAMTTSTTTIVERKVHDNTNDKEATLTTLTESNSDKKEIDDDTKKRPPEQHLFVWRTSTMAYSVRPKDFLKFAKHGSPTGGFVHLQTGKLIVLTSLHLQCGGTSGPRESGAYYQSALQEYSTLLETYWSIPKPVRFLNEEWTCAYERTKAACADHLHILGGDLNLNPHLLKDQRTCELMNKSGFMSTGNRYTVTNAGAEERGYDFFLLDERIQRIADVHQRVLRSSSTKKNGNVGLSDHDPVVLHLDFFEKVDAKCRTFQST